MILGRTVNFIFQLILKLIFNFKFYKKVRKKVFLGQERIL